MERYRIYATTDGKFKGKIFTIDEIENTIDIIGEDVSPEHQTYTTITKTSNTVRVSNSNYTIHGKLI
jgi:hypothetical protein